MRGEGSHTKIGNLANHGWDRKIDTQKWQELYLVEDEDCW